MLTESEQLEFVEFRLSTGLVQFSDHALVFFEKHELLERLAAWCLTYFGSMPMGELTVLATAAQFFADVEMFRDGDDFWTAFEDHMMEEKA